MFNSENRVGRLVELRVATPIALVEIAQLQTAHLGVIQEVGGQCVVAVDMRAATVFPPGIADLFIRMMSALNPKVQRSAILVSESALLGMQADRAIQEAGAAAERRVFRSTRRLEAWLSEVLEAEEVSRLRRFLEDQPEP